MILTTTKCKMVIYIGNVFCSGRSPPEDPLRRKLKKEKTHKRFVDVNLINILSHFKLPFEEGT